MAQITFKISESPDVVIHANKGDRLLDIARDANVAIDAPCSGNATCGKCKVKLVSGAVDSPKTQHITEEEYAAGWRLACVSKVLDEDLVIEVPDIASAYKSRMKVADLSSPEEVAIFEKIKSDIEGSGIALTNDMAMVELTMDAPSLDDTMPDNERLTWAIEAAVGAEKVVLPFTVVKKLPDVLREGNFSVKAIYKMAGSRCFVYDIYPAGENPRIVGLAIDIGTTTVSSVLIDMQTGEILAKGSAGNGQIRYGADVINRIVEQTKPGGVKKLQKAIIDDTLNPMIANMCRSIGIKPVQIYRMSLASNSTMNHLFMGVNADPLRMEPYIPTFFHLKNIYAKDLNLIVNPNADIIFAPNIGSYVGGDITAGTLASGIWNSEEFSVFIDLGTNGEIVFGNSDFLMSCACSAGPAFEGGDISCGMRATDGAIEAVTIDKETMEPTLSIIGDEGQQPIGLCGSGIIDIIAELFRCGIVNAKGQLVREGRRVKVDEDGMKSYIIAFKEDTGAVKDVEITEVDIDSFIRAKGAIYSGIITLVESLGFDMSIVDNVYVAGGIGSGINMKNAVRIGMLPDIPLEKYHYIGNSSLAGSYAMLLSNEAEDKVTELASSMTYLELSTHPGYMDSFVAACFIPHTDADLFPSVQNMED
ncbi:MAG: corrinoid activation/regeneration protein AcsV [Lachnospiraceae bacterium]|nr:corrinoid activation/regeneration protein AcsV [Lachnospiraceae bacterium]MDY4969078.1 corrinoid activation/regeneration protein AcsV [Lachnospiraceae bacterium]